EVQALDVKDALRRFAPGTRHLAHDHHAQSAPRDRLFHRQVFVSHGFPSIREVSAAFACIRTPCPFTALRVIGVLFNCRMTKRGWILFISLGLLWGMPYLLIRIAVGSVDPLIVAGSRTLIGALLLLPIALHRNVLGAAFRQWKWLLAFTLIEISIPWVMLGH